MIKKYIYLLFLIYGCASITALDGGEVDKTPPVILSTYPDSAELNVLPAEVRITFDEYVMVKNIRDLLIISPTPSTEVKTEIKKKTLIIKFQDSLLPNTTYSVQLNGSVADYNEGNPVNDFQLYFSTGGYIDSLQYGATIINAYTKEACGECILALYNGSEDSSVLLSKPVYLGRSNNAGRVKIPHLRPDTFRAIVLKDENQNLLLDAQEWVSLYQDVVITDSMDMDSFYIFPYEPANPPRFELQNKRPGQITIYSSMPLRKKVDLKIDGLGIDYTKSEKADTLTTYVNPNLKDSFLIEVLYAGEIDTLHYIIKRRANKLAWTIIPSDEPHELILRTGLPIAQIDSTKLYVLSDSLPVKIQSINVNGREALITLEEFSSQNVQVILDKDMVSDLSSLTNEKDTLNIYFPEPHNSNLDLDINLSDTAHYLLILEQNDKIVEQSTLEYTSTILFNNLKEGTYRIRIVKDDNQNGLWDPGDPLLNLPAEDTYLSEEVEMRKNWDKQLIINY